MCLAESRDEVEKDVQVPEPPNACLRDVEGAYLGNLALAYCCSAIDDLGLIWHVVKVRNHGDLRDDVSGVARRLTQRERKPTRATWLIAAVRRYLPTDCTSNLCASFVFSK